MLGFAIGSAPAYANNPRNPSLLAAHTPRSVISAVSSLAGVTSKAGLVAGLPGAAMSRVTQKSNDPLTNNRF